MDARGSIPNPFDRCLSHAVSQSVDGDEINIHTFAEKFFQCWFREEGTCHFFLFKKNLRVTNIQFGELFSLLKVNLSLSGYERVPHLRFLSVREFSDSLRRISETFELRNPERRSAVANMYAKEFAQTLVIDPLFCSCLVYVPPLLRVNLENICAGAGYVHPCGRTILSKLVYKTTTKDLVDSLIAFREK